MPMPTIFVGNGPAGIALSALLSGWQPFYNRRHPHPDPQMHEQLLRMADDEQQSLLAQDLCSLADQHFAHSETTAGPGGTRRLLSSTTVSHGPTSHSLTMLNMTRLLTAMMMMARNDGRRRQLLPPHRHVCAGGDTSRPPVRTSCSATSTLAAVGWPMTTIWSHSDIQLARLSPAVYPEYARVFRLLSGRTREVNYRRLLGTSVRTIGTASNATTTTTAVAATAGPKASTTTTTTTGGAVLLFSTTEQHQQRGRQDMTTMQQQHHQQQQQLREQSFRALAVCIGRRSDLPMLKEYLPNSDFTYEFNTRYQSVTDPALFAVGAMAGDHFVRYLVGGALCVAQTIINGRQQQQRQKKQHQQQRVQDVHPAATEVPPLSERVEDADRKRQVHRRLRDRLGTGCAILRTAAVASTAANPLVATTAAVARAKQFIGRAKSQLQLKTTTVV
uniref:FAD_binding_3 domain-containing protein n=1 Tax=Globodera pallida TaxID=36090 RepID=A0A183BPD4_GLOPA